MSLPQLFSSFARVSRISFSQFALLVSLLLLSSACGIESKNQQDRGGSEQLQVRSSVTPRFASFEVYCGALFQPERFELSKRLNPAEVKTVRELLKLAMKINPEAKTCGEAEKVLKSVKEAEFEGISALEPLGVAMQSLEVLVIRRGDVRDIRWLEGAPRLKELYILRNVFPEPLTNLSCREVIRTHRNISECRITTGDR